MRRVDECWGRYCCKYMHQSLLLYMDVSTPASFVLVVACVFTYRFRQQISDVYRYQAFQVPVPGAKHQINKAKCSPSFALPSPVLIRTYDLVWRETMAELNEQVRAFESCYSIRSASNIWVDGNQIVMLAQVLAAVSNTQNSIPGTWYRTTLVGFPWRPPGKSAPILP